MMEAIAGPIQIEGGRKVLREKEEGSEMGRTTIRGGSCSGWHVQAIVLNATTRLLYLG